MEEYQFGDWVSGAREVAKLELIFDEDEMEPDQSVNFGSTSNRKNLKISVFGCFRVNLLEFGFRKYDLRKFGKLCNLLFLFFINL